MHWQHNILLNANIEIVWNWKIDSTTYIDNLHNRSWPKKKKIFLPTGFIYSQLRAEVGGDATHRFPIKKARKGLSLSHENHSFPSELDPFPKTLSQVPITFPDSTVDVVNWCSREADPSTVDQGASLDPDSPLKATEPSLFLSLNRSSSSFFSRRPSFPKWLQCTVRSNLTLFIGKLICILD